MKNSKINKSNECVIQQDSEEKLAQTYKAFAADFASQIISGDFNSASKSLAVWLRISPDEFRTIFEKELWKMNSYWDISELIYPADFTISWNKSTFESLKTPMSWRESRNISDEITSENFRKWMVIQFLPDENDERIEFDGWFDFWFVVAEVNGEFKIGFFEFEDPD